MSKPSPNERLFVSQVVRFHLQEGRQDLPWQQHKTPYRVWVSEIMLQQTQVATVIGYFDRFMQRFPDVVALANAPLDEVTALWAGLGYYARARYLHRAAIQVRDAGWRELPLDFDALVNLPGIGRSTAGAILSLAGDLPYPILDGNVRRVMARYFGLPYEPSGKGLKLFWALAEKIMPSKPAGIYNQGLMDLGATVCTPRSPRCLECPLKKNCFAFQRDLIPFFPRDPKKVAVKEETIHWTVFTADNAIFLIQRPEKGIWARLYSFPEWTPAQIKSLCPQKAIREKEVWPERTHLLTHRKLKLRITHVKLHAPIPFPGGAWYDKISLKKQGKPTPVARVIQDIERMEQGGKHHGLLCQTEERS